MSWTKPNFGLNINIIQVKFFVWTSDILPDLHTISLILPLEWRSWSSCDITWEYVTSDACKPLKDSTVLENLEGKKTEHALQWDVTKKKKQDKN